MGTVRIQTGGRSPSEIEQYLIKAARAVDMSQDRNFHDPVMQQEYDGAWAIFQQVLDAMIDEISELQ